MQWLSLTVLSFLCAGLAQITFKMIAATQVNVYLLYSYGTACVFSGICVFCKRIRVQKKECLFGVLLGLSSVIQAYFCILALQGLPGVVVYPVVGIGSLLAVTAWSLSLLKEKLESKEVAGIACGLLAIALLSA